MGGIASTDEVLGSSIDPCRLFFIKKIHGLLLMAFHNKMSSMYSRQKRAVNQKASCKVLYTYI